MFNSIVNSVVKNIFEISDRLWTLWTRKKCAEKIWQNQWQSIWRFCENHLPAKELNKIGISFRKDSTHFKPWRTLAKHACARFAAPHCACVQLQHCLHWGKISYWEFGIATKIRFQSESVFAFAQVDTFLIIHQNSVSIPTVRFRFGVRQPYRKKTYVSQIRHCNQISLKSAAVYLTLFGVSIYFAGDSKAECRSHADCLVFCAFRPLHAAQGRLDFTPLNYMSLERFGPVLPRSAYWFVFGVAPCLL